MISPVYWIDHAAAGRLGTMARPRGGDWLDDEIRALAAADVTALVSLLTAAENRELLLVDEAARCADHGLTFVSFPIPILPRLRWTRPHSPWSRTSRSALPSSKPWLSTAARGSVDHR